MTHCAQLTSMRVDGNVLHLGLHSGEREIAVRASMASDQGHALRHLHTAQRIRTQATGRDALWDLLLGVAAGRVPVEVATPELPEDWDAALADLVADEA